jgi:hypothetical protein
MVKSFRRVSSGRSREARVSYARWMLANGVLSSCVTLETKFLCCRISEVWRWPQEKSTIDPAPNMDSKTTPTTMSTTTLVSFVGIRFGLIRVASFSISRRRSTNQMTHRVKIAAQSICIKTKILIG